MLDKLRMALNPRGIDVKAKIQNYVDATPLVFLVVGILSFILFGIFESVYYYDISHKVIKYWGLSLVFSLAFPFILELGQFGFMLATISNINNRNKGNKILPIAYGIIGIVATIIIINFKLGELDNMVTFWQSGIYSNHIKSALRFLVILGVILEIRIIMIKFD